MYKAGLVLEGGGMKGVYTAGVLDAFLENNIEFSSVYGVSAGIITGTSYLSKQKGRMLQIWKDHLGKTEYCSIKSLLTTGDLFNVKMSYHTIPQKLNPYDYETFQKFLGKTYSVVTNIETGKPEYLRIKDMKKEIDYVRASGSLPLLARTVFLHGKPYLDGGISDAIPIQKSILDGNTKNIVILTKEVGYVRHKSSHLGLIKARYFKYPKVYELMKNRHIHYNNTLKFLEQQVQNGQAFVIRPKHKSDVGRIEKDIQKIIALYKEGYEDGKQNLNAIRTYLEN